MTKPLVSVVMIVRNVERFLAEAIESILAQSFRDFEFIIVDFGSTDRSKEIITSYVAKDSRVILDAIPSCDLAEARNAACHLAQGKYIALMDADDISLPDRLKLEVEFMERHPKVGLVGGAAEWIDATGTPVAGRTISFPLSNREIQTALATNNTFWQDAVLMRREAFTLAGGYRKAFVQAEDYDLWVRISEHLEMANLEQAVFKYRIHPQQVSLRRRRTLTLCSMAVRASAELRRSGQPDPMDTAEEVTPELLVTMGVSEAKQQATVAISYQGWIQIMCAAGEWSAALGAAIEMLESSDWSYITKRQLSDMRIETAQLYWKDNQFLKGIVTAAHAVMARPTLAGRPLRLAVRRLSAWSGAAFRNFGSEKLKW